MSTTPLQGITYGEKEANQLAKELSIDFNRIPINEFVKGLNVETEHGSKYEDTNITHDIDILTAKLALAHLRHIPDYYTRLEKMMHEAYRYWAEH
jgi:hypothetical protein